VNTRLLQQLVERIAAARGVQEVCRDHRVVRERRRRDASRRRVWRGAAGWAQGAADLLPVVRLERALAPRLEQHVEARSRARQHLLRTGGSGPYDRLADSARRHRRGALRKRPEIVERPCSRAGHDLLADPPHRRRVLRPEGLLQAAQRIAQLEAPKDLAQPRAIGRSRDHRGQIDAGLDVPLERRELLRDPGEICVLAQVLPALLT
jgi:hypothetical protein